MMKKIFLYVYVFLIICIGKTQAQDFFTKLSADGGSIWGNQTGVLAGPRLSIGSISEYLFIGLEGSYMVHRTKQEYIPGIATASNGSLIKGCVSLGFNIAPVLGGRSDGSNKLYVSLRGGYYSTISWQMSLDDTGEYTKYLLNQSSYRPKGLYGDGGLMYVYDFPRSQLSLSIEGSVGYYQNDITRPEPEIAVPGSKSRGTFVAQASIGLQWRPGIDVGRHKKWRRNNTSKWKPGKPIKPRF